VDVIPTCVDPRLYPLARHVRDKGDAQLVWVGSSSTLRGLEAIEPLLEELGRRIPGLQLKLVCDRFLPLAHLPVVPCRWSEEGEAEALAAADVGISWLPDDLWSRGKCGLKVLQYMAAGLPVVANPVGVQCEMVRHGETGFLAQTPGEWVEAVGRLAHDPDLRRRMGSAGRRRMESDYDVESGAARWLAVFDRLSRPATRAG
jgi:glycosyltransferase involved in cell wall biosynthesis